MSHQSISFALIFFWLGGMALSSSEVVLVNRNQIDSFRVGKDGCRNNISACPTSATCQTSDGLCHCNRSTPTYRKFLNTNYGLKGLVYGCVNDSLIGVSSNYEKDHCLFTTSNVIPFSLNSSAVKFSYVDSNEELKNCTLVKAWTKTPNTAVETELSWMNDSYVGLNVSDNSLYLKWKMPMPELQGTIIYFSLKCENSSGQQFESCLGGKVLGTWLAAPTAPTTQTTPTTTATSEAERTNSTITKEESDYNLNILTKIVMGVLALSLLVNIILAIVVRCLRKKQQSNQRTHLEETEMTSIESNVDGYTVVTRGEENKGASITNNERTSGVYDYVHPGTSNVSSIREPYYKNNERLSDIYEVQDPAKKYTTLRRGDQEDGEEKYQSLKKD